MFDRDIARSPPTWFWKRGLNRAAHRPRPPQSTSSLRFVLVAATVAVAVVILVVKANAASALAGIAMTVAGAVAVVVAVFSLGSDDHVDAPPRASHPPLPLPSSVGRSSSPLSGGEDGTVHTSTNHLTVGTRTDVPDVLLAVTTFVPHAVILTPPHDPIDLAFVVVITIVPTPPSFYPSLALLPQEPHEVGRTQQGVGRDYHVHCPPSRRLPPTPLLLLQQQRGVGQELIDDQWRQPLHDGSVAVGREGQEEDAIAPVHESGGLPVRARYSSQSSSSLWRFHLLRSLGLALDAIVIIPPPEQPRSTTVGRPPGAKTDAAVAMNAIGVECCVWDQRPVMAVAVRGERRQEGGW